MVIAAQFPKSGKDLTVIKDSGPVCESGFISFRQTGAGSGCVGVLPVVFCGTAVLFQVPKNMGKEGPGAAILRRHSVSRWAGQTWV